MSDLRRLNDWRYVDDHGIVHGEAPGKLSITVCRLIVRPGLYWNINEGMALTCVQCLGLISTASST